MVNWVVSDQPLEREEDVFEFMGPCGIASSILPMPGSPYIGYPHIYIYTIRTYLHVHMYTCEFMGPCGIASSIVSMTGHICIHMYVCVCV